MRTLMRTCSRRRHADRGGPHARAHHGAGGAPPASPRSACTSASPDEGGNQWASSEFISECMDECVTVQYSNA